MSSLDSRVSACEANFAKVKDFIRDNIGPDLSHVKALVRAELKTTNAPCASCAPQFVAMRRDFERQLAQQKAELIALINSNSARAGGPQPPPKAANGASSKQPMNVADELAAKLKARNTGGESVAVPPAPAAAPAVDETPAWISSAETAATTESTSSTKAADKAKEKAAKKEARKAEKKAAKKRAAAAAAAASSGKSAKSSIFDDSSMFDDDVFGGGKSSKKSAADSAADDDDDDDDSDDFDSLSSAVLGRAKKDERASDAPPAHIVARALGLDKDDDEWSDEDAEIETLRLVVQDNKQLRSLEDLHMKRPSRVVKRDVVSMATLSRANSTALKDTVYFFGAGDYGELAGKVRHLAALGARILFHPMAANEKWTFGVRATDRLFPICPDGMSQSQVLFHVLSGVKRWLGVAHGCEPPHGAVSGFDPYPRPKLPQTDDQNAVVSAAAAFTEEDIVAAVRAGGYEPRVSSPTIVAKAFEHALGVPFVPRFGEPMAASLKYGLVYNRANQSVWQSIDTNVGKMREYFDLFYFDTQKASEQQRFVYLVFGNALPVLFERLLENNRSLNNVWIVALPFENDAANSALVNSQLTRMPPGTPPMLASTELCVQLYKDLANIFRPLLQRKL
jgi:hypothetical protein